MGYLLAHFDQQGIFVANSHPFRRTYKCVNNAKFKIDKDEVRRYQDLNLLFRTEKSSIHTNDQLIATRAKLLSIPVMVMSSTTSRLQTAVGEGESATLLTLTLLEAAVKNCG